VTDSSPGAPPETPACASVTVTVHAPMVAPVITVGPSSVLSGGSATLSTTTSFSGGTPTYACGWDVKAPGAIDFTTLASTFACSPGGMPTVSTGTLTTLGTWSFVLVVSDSSTGNTNYEVLSNVVTVYVA
jgi:hypothetical protein